MQVPMDDPVSVYWYDHDCEWISKYCETEHTRSSLIPLSVLKKYATRMVGQYGHALSPDALPTEEA
jgi:hypothetical protein